MTSVSVAAATKSKSRTYRSDVRHALSWRAESGFLNRDNILELVAKFGQELVIYYTQRMELPKYCNKNKTG